MGIHRSRNSLTFIYVFNARFSAVIITEIQFTSSGLYNRYLRMWKTRVVREVPIDRV